MSLRHFTLLAEKLLTLALWLSHDESILRIDEVWAAFQRTSALESEFLNETVSAGLTALWTCLSRLCATRTLGHTTVEFSFLAGQTEAFGALALCE